MLYGARNHGGERAMRSSTIIGGASDKNARHASDFYATPPDCTNALMDHFGWVFEGRKIWEPACGDGAISKVLIDRGFDVVSTDLHGRGYAPGGVDFLECEKMGEAIITNPPFNLAHDFIARSIDLDVPFAMLVKATYWHAGKRLELFSRKQPIGILAMAWRPAMSPERGKSATMDFIWTIWGEGSPPHGTKYKIAGRN
jgi:hypothetical protein